ncbi:hypothetical protein SRED_002252 [Spiroplasma melliferum]|uniref:Spiroplasmavirus-related protein n=1 Tax=Spiroplasma melliferum TaxID=2134 RepID=A0ABX5UCZ0_SPIME|nr:hypothetical protein [Spiroplasma melliferum]QCO23778.1 hypothetical protein SRED_002252 [Spiroplasma melliferum]
MNELKFVNGKKVKINDKNIFDQYFTKRSIAEKLFNNTVKILNSWEKKFRWFFLNRA